MKILAFDTETGGLDPKVESLLTAYFQVLDKDLNVIDSLSLIVKPDYGEIKANSYALAVNKIDLEEHEKIAIPYSFATEILIQFLNKHSTKHEKLTPLAHNIDFDLGFLNEHLLSKKKWEQFVSYRKLDTANIANFLQLCDIIPKGQKLALGELASYMKIVPTADLHNAEADVKVMVEVLKKFINKLK